MSFFARLRWRAAGCYLAALYLAEPYLVRAPAPVQRFALWVFDGLAKTL
jgi:hypothetical protein